MTPKPEIIYKFVRGVGWVPGYEEDRVNIESFKMSEAYVEAVRRWTILTTIQPVTILGTLDFV